jgi:hypothetical protein
LPKTEEMTYFCGRPGRERQQTAGIFPRRDAEAGGDTRPSRFGFEP